MIFSQLSSAKTLREKLFCLERHELEGATLHFPEQLDFLSGFSFVRIDSRLALLEGTDTNIPVDLPVCSLLGSLHSLNLPFCFMLEGEQNRVNVFLGIRDGVGCPQRAILEGYWGCGCCSDAVDTGERIRRLADHSVCGALSGIPSLHRRSKREMQASAPSSRWIRGLWGRRWSFLVCGFPLSDDTISGYRDSLIAEIAGQRTGVTRSEILLNEQRLAEQYLSGVEQFIKRLAGASGSGVWQIGAWLFAGNELDVRLGLGLLSADFGGSVGQSQPLRAHLCRKDNSLTPSFINLLTTQEAATLVSIPDQESPGFAMRKSARFDCDVAAPATPALIVIGGVVKDGVATGIPFSVPLESLTRHGLVAGVTGSGKTTTCKQILRQLREQHVPFLVIESAKSEYRCLLAEPAFEDMLVFTLGDETPGRSAPFRMNPFEVPSGILVQSHLDYLKALFRASFVMYAPMPYVLEEALHEIYRDKGWNLSANQNTRGIDPLAFPTLTDLYEKIDDVVNRLGYDERIAKDILAGLKTRINNLRLGAKGLMLDTTEGVPVEELLRRPVLLELHRLGNDDEKAFLIGLILTRIYEHYQTDHSSPPAHGLRHLILIEEAHRLFKHVPEESAEGEGNMRAAAVETFCSMLAEIRAYGEGLLVAEQIPTKLARDVLKNTSLKVMHRLVARDDRDTLGDTMNLSQPQKRHAVALERGRAAVFGEGMDEACLIDIPSPPYNGQEIGDVFVYSHMRRLFYDASPGLLLPHVACACCPARETSCGTIREIVRAAVLGRQGIEQFNRIFFAAIRDEALERLTEPLMMLLGGARYHPDDRNAVLSCLLVHGARQSLESQGRMYGYTYADMRRLMHSFMVMAVTHEAGSELPGSIVNPLRRRSDQPFEGCVHCVNRCQYRYEISLFISDAAVSADFRHITTAIDDDNDMWQALASLCRRVSSRLYDGTDSGLMRELTLCFVAQKVAAVELAPTVQERVVRNVMAALDTMDY
jgi:Helicase HerA, central domain